MIQTCLLCGKPMQSMRSTKKYCSDNCKQLAFYKRSGLQLSGVIVKEHLFNDKPTPFNNNSIADADERLINIAPLKTDEQRGLSLNDKSSSTVADAFTSKQQQDEPAYQWEYSNMIDSIMKYAENDKELSMFQYPEKYWGTYTLPTVKWVSLRLRCLLESLIGLSNLKSITYADLTAVKAAFNALIASQHFNNLPTNYPYTTLVKELQPKIALLAKQFKRKSSFLFRLTPNRKAELIGKRYILADFVPTIDLRELDFNE